MTRKVKIARLPQDAREELNRRLADGEPGKVLVAGWASEGQSRARGPKKRGSDGCQRTTRNYGRLR